MKKLFLFLNLIILCTLCGCTSLKSLQNSLTYGISQRNPYEYSEKDDTKRAKAIKEAILAKEGIEDASVVITGNTALIGLVTDTGDSEAISKLKDEVSRLAHSTDGGIKNTSITTNGSIVEMIKNMEESKLSYAFIPDL